MVGPPEGHSWSSPVSAEPAFRCRPRKPGQSPGVTTVVKKAIRTKTQIAIEFDRALYIGLLTGVCCSPVIDQRTWNGFYSERAVRFQGRIRQLRVGGQSGEGTRDVAGRFGCEQLS